ncbi:hypothetical protein L228DRAFT_16097 [Xylona heveae TC161]|uniref:Uncharacterized protein n=1 Tax=Xylona heveae (strain CBS 132557 / TC161) TaxID=1328760 RepID=A0A165JUC0_XYLHT|nr:hypothetical protein L228DRAFT_16097 [Xylona heveae TC161]KZF26638.1 hypothetical protein L228DRAFT_16097 [Xylona heveae TC161]
MLRPADEATKETTGYIGRRGISFLFPFFLYLPFLSEGGLWAFYCGLSIWGFSVTFFSRSSRAWFTLNWDDYSVAWKRGIYHVQNFFCSLDSAATAAAGKCSSCLQTNHTVCWLHRSLSLFLRVFLSFVSLILDTTYILNNTIAKKNFAKTTHSPYLPLVSKVSSSVL